MKRIVFLLLVFVLVGSTSIGPAYAERFQGQGASGFWMLSEPGASQDISIETRVGVFVFQGTLQEKGRPASATLAIVTISRMESNLTAGTARTIFEGFFGCFPPANQPGQPACPPSTATASFNTGRPEAPTQASLVGPLAGFGFQPEGGSGPMTVDVSLSWTGEGPTHFHDSERGAIGGVTFLTIINGHVMDNTEAAGTITIPSLGTLTVQHSVPGGPIAPGQGTFLGSFNVATKQIGK